MKNRRPRPVLTWAAITGAVMSGLVALVTMGVITIDPEQMGAIEKFLIALGPIVIATGIGFVPQRKVTPVSDPRNNAGDRLVPEASTPE